MSGSNFQSNQTVASTLLAPTMWRMAVAVAVLGAVGPVVGPRQVYAQALPSAEKLGEQQAADQADQQDEPDHSGPTAADENGDFAGQGVDQSDQSGPSDAMAGESFEPAKAPQDGPSAVDSAAATSADRDSRRPGPGMNTEGALGFQHIASAKSGKPNTYRVGFLSSFTTGSSLIRYQDQDDLVAGHLLVEASFLKYLSANMGVAARNNVNTFGRPQSMLAQGDLHLGVRGHLHVRPGVHLAAGVTAYAPTGFSSAGLAVDATSVRPRLLATVDVAELTATSSGPTVPAKAHVNVGYRVDNTSALVPGDVRPTRVERFAHQISAYDYLEIGVGFEYAFPYVSPFLGWNLDVPVNADGGICGVGSPLPCVSDKGIAGFPDKLSVGLRAEPIDHLGLTAGVDIGLSGEDVAGIPVTPPWTAVVGAQWAIDPEPKIEYVQKVVEKEKVVKEVPKQGFLMGTVTDANTGEPVPGAVVSYVAPTHKTPQATGEDGVFLSYGFAPGKEVVVEVNHPDYRRAEARRKIDGEGKVDVSVELTPAVDQGAVGGTVIDQDGDPISNADVKLTGPETVDVRTADNGQFRQEVTVGDYTLAAHADGYLTGGRDVEVTSDQKLQVEITLRPEPDEKLVDVQKDKIRLKQKVFFKTGKAKILPRSFDVLNQVASVLLETPRIDQLRVDGHTDDVGAEEYNLKLSRKRAASVRKYLIEQGIGAARIDSKGFGESQPLVPNTSKRNRSLNRRVEFRIVDQGLADTAKRDGAPAGGEAAGDGD